MAASADFGANVFAFIREFTAGAATLLQEIPAVGIACKTYLAFEDLVQTATSNKLELGVLQELCGLVLKRYVKRCTDNKQREHRGGLRDELVALENHIKSAEDVAGLCNGKGLKRLRHLTLCRKICNEITSVRKNVLEFCTVNNLVLTNELHFKLDDVAKLLEAQEQTLKVVMEKPGRVKIPSGAPSIRDWYVERVEVAAQICHHLGIGRSNGTAFFPEEKPRMVGLAGPGGAGKSTAASMVITQVDVQAFFQGRVLWLSVGKGAKDRLPSLMFELANMVRETVLGKTARRPREATVGINSEDGAAYIREEVGKGDRRFLVVADDVWDAEVLGELKRAGAWVIYTTRKTDLFPETPALRLEEVLKEEAEMVLRRAADLGEQAHLPPAAYELMKRCDFAVLDLALVGRWGNVRRRSCERAWREALDSIIETQSAGGDGVQLLPWRAAVLRAGLGVLASDNPQTTELYYALALLPTGLAFPSEVALILLFGDDFSKCALKAAEAVLGTLERLSILTLEENSGWYHVHENHVDFVLDRPLSKHYTRDTALPRWRRYISSVKALNTYSSAWLDKVWEKLAKVEGEGFVRSPYNAALSAIMDDSDGELLEALRRAAEFHFCREDWSEAFDKYSELLLIKEQTAGPDHPDVAHILHNLGMCASVAGREKETEGYLRRALAIQEEKLEPDDPNIASTLHSLGVYIRKTGKIDEAEGLIRRALEIRKGNIGADPLILGRTLHSLGVCAYDAVRLEEAEDLLRQALTTREGMLGSEHLEVADTLHVLGGCALKAGRMEDAEKLYLRALVIREEKLGTEHPDVSRTLRNLGICSVHKARLSEQTAGVVRRTLAIV